eukprot:TRINITY_DN21742_c1_g2_i1.p1 TRINITY_DN21742_c1_g2~~TRINITY_DN21742_c1_g2_i1.p1  ORF type:complete len:440 (-),score=115.72 TRINITY_DN21742_c1_g2_i1:76-1395(-)
MAHGGSDALERDLEHIIANEELQMKQRTVEVKRARRSAGLGQLPMPSAAPPVPGSSDVAGAQAKDISALHETYMKHLKAQHVAACRTEGDHISRRNWCSKELQLTQQAVHEARKALEGANSDIPACQTRLLSSKEHLQWLEDFHSHGSRAIAKDLFDPAVSSAVRMSMENLQIGINLQSSLVKEAQHAVMEAQSLKERLSKDFGSKQQNLEQAQDALRSAEEEVRIAKSEVAHLEKQAHWARGALKKMQDLTSVEEQCRASSREAARLRDDAQRQFADHCAWGEDLQAVFEGQRAKNCEAIVSGLQDVLPTGDPLPMMIRAMLTGSGTVDRSNGTVQMLRKHVAEPIVLAKDRLQKRLEHCQAKCVDAERAHSQALNSLRQQEDLLQQTAAEEYRRSPAGRVPVPNTVATPLKCAEARQETSGKTSCDAPPKRGRPSVG